MAISTLVDFNPEILQKEHDDSSCVGRLLKLFRQDTEIDALHTSLECVTINELLMKILVPLTKTVVVENKNRSKMREECEDITFENLGMGSVNTWHGEPDIRVRGFLDTEVDVMHTTESLSGYESDGTSLTIDGKAHLKLSHMAQLVATTVISSFVENCRHPDANPLVPGIMMNTKSIRVCLYNCKVDILLISEEVDIVNSDHTINRAGIVFLWLFLNHR